MIKNFLALALAAALTAALADPEISNQTIDYSGQVKVSYVLTGGPAIVTATFYEDGEQIPPEELSSLSGDLGTSVASGQRLITWNALKDRPDLANHSKTIRVELKAYPADDPPDFVVIPLVANAYSKMKFYSSAAEIPGGLGVDGDDNNRTNNIVMRRIRARDVTWTRGGVYYGKFSDNNDPGRQLAHEVCLEHDYWIAVYELTGAQYAKLCNSQIGRQEPFSLYQDVRPCSKMYYDALRISNKTITDFAAADHPENPPPDANNFLGAARAYTGLMFDIPTESEWEFAAKAGTAPNRWNTDVLVTNETTDANCPGRYSRNGGCYYDEGSGTWKQAPEKTSGLDAGTAKVGSYDPNAWGIYDMHGNVMEWCRDFWLSDPSGLGGVLNSTFYASQSSSHAGEGVHVLRGGYYQLAAGNVQLVKRTSEPIGNSYAGMGCRLVLPIDFTSTLTGN